MSSALPAALLGHSAEVGKIFDDGIDALLTIHKDSVFVTWEGCVPWKSGGADLPGAIGAFRRVGKPYEYERGEVKVRGYDAFIIMRTRDILAGKLRAQATVTVLSRERPDEPPTKYIVRMIDEMGDTNAQVYLLNMNSGTGEPEPPEEEKEPEGGRRGRKNGGDGDDGQFSPGERRRINRWR
jgi:hypothetical protein